MPIDRRFDSSTDVLWTTAHGRVTVDDVRLHFKAIRDMHGHQYCEVIDTRLALPAFGVRDLKQLAKEGRRALAHSPMAPRAIVVAQNHLIHYGLAKLFASFVMPWLCMRVFDSLPAALAYIDGATAAL
jgi:hypothetical protein